MATHLSKQRYADIVSKVEEAHDTETAMNVAAIIREVCKYDPSVPYPKRATPLPPNPEYGQRYIEKRKALAAETGVSTYILSGRKKHYEKQKALKAAQLQKEREEADTL